MTRRERLMLAAAAILAGFASNPETSGEPPARLARWAVALAREIEKQLTDEEDNP